MQKKKKHYHFSFEKSKKVDAVQFVSIELIELIDIYRVVQESFFTFDCCHLQLLSLEHSSFGFEFIILKIG